MNTVEYGTGFFGTKKLTIYFMDILCTTEHDCFVVTSVLNNILYFSLTLIHFTVCSPLLSLYLQYGFYSDQEKPHRIRVKLDVTNLN